MANSEEIRQRVLTFSLVSQGFGNSLDPIAALLPFLVPIANDLANGGFDVSVFRSEMRERYGIVLSRDVTEVFVQRLLALKLLRKIANSNSPIWVKQNEANKDFSETATRLDELIIAASKLHSQRADLLKTPFVENNFLNALMKVLLNENSSLQNAVRPIESADSRALTVADNARRALGAEEYFASEFIAWTSKNNKNLFRWLADLSGAAFVSEALIGIRTPQPNQTIRPDVTVYLDTPFFMELLGCSGQAERDDAKLIVDSLQSQKIPVSVLSHSVEELRGNLIGVLKAATHTRNGPTAKALLYREVTESYLQSVLADPEHFAAQLNIKIIDPKKLSRPNDLIAFTETQEQNFFAAIYGLHDNQLARERDVASISWVMRRRAGESIRDVLKSKYLLLTRNNNLVRYANKFAIEQCGTPKGAAGPAILARDLAGILWLLVGQNERHEISERQLILSCERARSAAPEIISGMYEIVNAVDPKNAELLWAAVQKPSYLSMALDAVSSTLGPVRIEDADAALAKIRDDLVREERARTKDTLEREKEKYTAENALQKLVNDSLARDMEKIEQEKERMENHFRSVSHRFWSNNKILAQKSFYISKIIINITLIIMAIFSAIFETDFIASPWYSKALVAALVAILLLYGGNRFISDWLHKLIGNWFSRRYEKQFHAFAGEYAAQFKLSSPMLGE